MDLLGMLADSLGGGSTRSLSKSVGVKEDVVSNVVSSALPLLLGALNRNTNDSNGASSLLSAIEKDHDGSILDDLGGFFNNAPTQKDNRMVDHILGNKRAAVEKNLGRANGIDAGDVGNILMQLAPVVLGALGKQKKSSGFDASMLGDLLNQEERRVQKKAPDAFGMIGSLLDADGDGDATDDMLKMGAGLLGGLFNKKR